MPEELREEPTVADGDEGDVEQKVETVVENEPKLKEVKSKEPKPKSSKSSVYIVKSGDNLGRISEKFHVKMNELKKANNLSGDALKVGQELIIP
ncbi:MAG: LysM peptidoglycan-binding domain-containing protein [Crocinitomicaceae bacterium]|nr:LysM peptidoglycan-binding domain-containing protein [Crocinitomicaceae bacterium]